MQEDIIAEKYRLIRELSSGGMGTVYEALHRGTGRRVALKLIRAEAAQTAGLRERVQRFEREALAAGAVDSQHVVQVTDAGLDVASGRPFLVMELLLGEDLRQLLGTASVLPTDLVLRIAAQACLGLARAHERGVVHRDVKPANIFLSRNDKAAVVVKILDFGIAKIREQPWAAAAQELTQSGAVIGSPSYMSPEQALGSRSLDARSDLWSLGVVMYEALCGSTPHGRELTLGALIVEICSRPAPPLRERAPWVVEEAAAVVHKALALEPSQRFGTALEMHAAILALLPDDTIADSMLASVPSNGNARSDVGQTNAGNVRPTAVLHGPLGRRTGAAEGLTLSELNDGGPRKRHRLSMTALLIAATAVLLIAAAATRALRQPQAAQAPAPSRAASPSSAAPASEGAQARTEQLPAVPATHERARSLDAVERSLDVATSPPARSPSHAQRGGARAPRGPRTAVHVAAAEVSVQPQAVSPPPNPTIDRDF